ncbi:hypothetical protein IGI42_004107 [Enterococcus sp. AZ109]
MNAYLNIFAIFLLVFLAYFLAFKGWFSNRTADEFSLLILNLALPLSTFLNIIKNFDSAAFLQLFSGMLIPLLSMAVTFFLSLGYRRMFKVTQKRWGTFSTMFTCSNTIFLGLPINLAIFGESSVAFVLLYYIVNTTFFWTIGVFQIAQDNPRIDEATASFHPLVALRKIFSPALLGFLIGIFWLLLKLPLPPVLFTFFNYLASLTTPLSMFVIGIMIYFSGIKNLSLDKDVIGVLIGRYLISPLTVIVLCRFIQIPDLMFKVFLVQSTMPVQNSVPILVRSYRGDENFSTSSLGFSILVYLFYIPLLLYLFV